jgi:cell division protein FtsW (lipid II flippase)
MRQVNKEMALVFILVHMRGVKPSSLVQLNRKQGKSWSEIAFQLGIQPAEAGKYILAYPEKKLPE